jgi:hypothetical protein
MDARFNQVRAIIMLASASLGINPASQAAASFTEGLDNVGPTIGAGPQNLTNQGWILRNQSRPAGATVWRQGRSFSFPNFTPQSGNGYLTNWSSWGGYELRMSCVSRGIAVLTVTGMSVLPGDLDGDGAVNFGDTNPLVALLSQ